MMVFLAYRRTGLAPSDSVQTEKGVIRSSENGGSR